MENVKTIAEFRAALLRGKERYREEVKRSREEEFEDLCKRLDEKAMQSGPHLLALPLR